MGNRQLTKILVVEDESIVAKNIQNRLKRLGYIVPAIVSSGEEAIRKAEETHPDLVLMDIVLKGNMDGVEAAKQIYARFNIPVVYLTAYADENTLERAKITEPFGYILKPFEVRGLRSTIEIALYKHKTEKELKEKKKWLATTLKSIGDAVIVTNTNGFITFMNPAAEALTAWKWKDALGKDLGEVFNIINEETRTPLFPSGAHCASDTTTKNPVTKALRENTVVGLADYTILIAKDGRETPVDVSVAPIRDDKGNISGVVLVFRDTTEHKRGGDVLKAQKLESRISREKSGGIKVLLLLHTLDERLIISAMSLGVRGCLTDTLNAEQFIQAIRTISKDEIWAEVKVITKVLTRLLPSRRGNSRNLTKREEEIVKLVVQGYTNRQISKKLFISEKTIKTHLRNIFKKLGISTRLQLAIDFVGESIFKSTP